MYACNNLILRSVGGAFNLSLLFPYRYISEKEWKMVQSVAVSSDIKAILVGDSDGNVHVLVSVYICLCVTAV